jgi:hypothetical protein
MRQVIRLRKMDPSDRQEQESLLDLYKQALGMGVTDDRSDAQAGGEDTQRSPTAAAVGSS